MCSIGCKKKEEHDLRGKKIEDKEDAYLHTGCKSQDETIWGFVFKKKDNDSGGTENSVVFDEGIVGQGGDNSLSLMY